MYRIEGTTLRVSARRGNAGLATVYRVKDDLGRVYCEESSHEKALAHIEQLVAADARNAEAEAQLGFRQLVGRQ